MNVSRVGLLSAVALTSLFTGICFAQSGSDSARHTFSLADSTTTHSRPNTDTKFLLTAEQSGGRFTIVDEVFRPGMDSNPGHRHTFHSEVFFVISGSMSATVDGETQTLGPGDLVYIPPNSLHAIKILGDEDVHALMIYEPGGYEQGYFARGELTEEDRRDPETMQQLLKIMDVVPAARRGNRNAQ